MKPGRQPFIDTGRAIILLLGIPFHTAEAWRLGSFFAIVAPEPSLTLTLVSGLIHSFRMSALFLVSGLFVAPGIARHGATGWFVGRLERLAIPLVATTLLLGIAERALALGFAQGLGPGVALWMAFCEGPRQWLMHRWFLVVLLAHCLAVLPLVPVLPALQRAFLRLRQCDARLLALIEAAGLLGWGAMDAGIGRVVAAWAGDPEAWFALPILHYAPAFALGVLTGIGAVGQSRLFEIDRFLVLRAAVMLALYLVCYLPAGTPLPGGRVVAPWAGPILFPAIEPLTGWYTARLFLAVLRRHPVRQGPFIAFAVDNAMAIYLLHMIFVLALCALVMPTGVAPLPGAIAVIVPASLGVGALVWLCRGNALFGVLFNGRANWWNRRGRSHRQ